LRRPADRLLWLCVPIGIAAVIVIFLLFGLSLWSALAIASSCVGWWSCGRSSPGVACRARGGEIGKHSPSHYYKPEQRRSGASAPPATTQAMTATMTMR